MESINSAGYRNVKALKVASGSAFIEHLPRKLISFAGISGSVSYEPQREDDIDIFVISNQDCLWLTIAYAFMVRRLRGYGDVCLSLCMDSTFAHDFFSRSLDRLTARDAVRVIPVTGSQYYRGLLQLSSLTGNHGTDGHVESSEPGRSTGAVKILNFAVYIILGTYQQLKTRVTNRILRESGRSGECFEAKMGPHHFFLDSMKYRRLREEEKLHDY
jgi:hypothetical protein